MTDARPARRVDVTRATLAPLAVIGLAYGLWWISDRLLYVGPLDRAAFGWLVVMPVWSLAPAAAAWVGRRLPERTARAAIGGAATVLGLATFVLLWTTAVREGMACETGPRTDAIGWIAPAGLFALVLAATWAGTALAATGWARRSPFWQAVAVSVVGTVVGFVVVIGMLTFWLIFYAGCNRPI